MKRQKQICWMSAREFQRELTPISDIWYSQGASVVSDGWTNCQNQLLKNIITTNSHGTIFLYVEDFSGIKKIGLGIVEFLLGAIEDVEASNILQLVTNNAINCRLAGKETQKVYNHIFCSPCIVHTLNLILKEKGVFRYLKLC